MSYLFEDENTTENKVEEEYWHILSVDDEPSIHQITKLVLSGLTFENKKIKLSTADSAEEAIQYLKDHNDVALVLLDIVMERDDAGFDVANYLRDDVCNHTTRIIIRTGQPGNFPEDKIIQDFDIDGFSEKTELTSEKLHTVVYSALRAYRDISCINKCKTRLESLLESMSRLSTANSFEQLHQRLQEETKELVAKLNNIALVKKDKNEEMEVIFSNLPINEYLHKKINESASKHEAIFDDTQSVSYHSLANQESLHLCFEPDENLCQAGKKILASLADAVYLIYLNLEKEKSLDVNK